MENSLTGLFVPLITPFTADGRLAAGPLEALACRVLDAGAAGLVALGTTAETPTLSSAERGTVLDICAAVCRERGAALIAGAGSNDTAASARALAELARWPEVTAALTVVPYYSRPGEAGVLAHFSHLAAASPVPLVLYHIPYRTGQPLSWQAICQLGELPGIAGIKHAVGGIDADTVHLMAGLPDGFSVLAGDDLFAPSLLALGAHGAIQASANVATAQFAAHVAAWRAGDLAGARAAGHRLSRLCAALFAGPNPTVIKAVLHAGGQIPSPQVRLPLLPASAGTTDSALRLLALAGSAAEEADPLNLRLATEPALIAR
jgi:4-hydroxy-tetrahydrodipicolinate synthase